MCDITALFCELVPGESLVTSGQVYRVLSLVKSMELDLCCVNRKLTKLDYVIN